MVEEWGGAKADSGPLLLASLLCEDTSTSVALGDGRVSLQRIFFVLYADGFPAAYDRMVATNFWLGAGSAGTYHESVRVIAPDGTEVGAADSDLVIPDQGEPLTRTQVYYFPGITLPEPGEYTVEVLLDGVKLHTHVVRVVDIGEEEDVAVED